MVHIGLIGCGYWGPNLLRNFAKVRECQVVAAADLDAGKLPLSQPPKLTTVAGPPLRSPWGLAWDGRRVFVANAGTHQIWVYDPAASKALRAISHSPRASASSAVRHSGGLGSGMKRDHNSRQGHGRTRAIRTASRVSAAG